MGLIDTTSFKLKTTYYLKNRELATNIGNYLYKWEITIGQMVRTIRNYYETRLVNKTLGGYKVGKCIELSYGQ
jgi:hypothetical protein